MPERVGFGEGAIGWNQQRVTSLAELRRDRPWGGAVAHWARAEQGAMHPKPQRWDPAAAELEEADIEGQERVAAQGVVAVAGAV